MKTITTIKSKDFNDSIAIPGDKSISHRSIILSAIAVGTTEIFGFLQGKDCLATINALRQLGVQIENADNKVTVYGVGLKGLQPSKHNIDLANSGTSMRILSGLLATQSFASTLVGDESLMSRPMRRVVSPLTKMAANITATNAGTPPIKIEPAENIHSIDYKIPVASAQVKSALLMAALYANGTTNLTELAITRDHTERMLRTFSVEVEQQDTKITLRGNQKLISPSTITVPSDISSAIFFIVATLISDNSQLLIKNVSINPTRSAILDILQAMGANIELTNTTDLGAEPVADIQVKSSKLSGCIVPEHLIAIAIDELPILAIAANFATTPTLVKGAKELRYKESDRINSIVTGLRAIGGKANEFEDGFEIIPSELVGGKVKSFDDHRIAMSFIIAGIKSKASIEIDDCTNIATSFPEFLDICRQLNIGFEIMYS